MDETCRHHGWHWLDAPVSGGQAGAENGQLSIMCGGDPVTFEKARTLMAAYAKAIVHIGPAGHGQKAKMVNQICIAGLVQALSEGLAFARKANLDIPKVMDAIQQGAAGSWQMSNRWQTMVEDQFDHGFAVNWMRKDLGYCLEEARKTGSSLPVTALVDQFYAQIEAMKGGRWDTSSLIMRLRR
jgi:3-hydroxyisobutyrate dehydrogenase-like beta-hydroxyacid dehydrogenase